MFGYTLRLAEVTEVDASTAEVALPAELVAKYDGASVAVDGKAVAIALEAVAIDSELEVSKGDLAVAEKSPCQTPRPRNGACCHWPVHRAELEAIC
jgi:hypothetical protein